MLETLRDWFDQIQLDPALLDVPPQTIAIGVLAVGIVVAVFGISSAFAGQSVEVRRMYGQAAGRRASDDYDLVRGDDNDTHGLLSAFVPRSTKDRSLIKNQLRKAGIQRRNALVYYYVVRSILGISLPLLFVGSLFLPAEAQTRLGIADFLAQRTTPEIFYICTILALVGFYLPYLWLKQKMGGRQQRIWETLPNALDLLQVSVEAGLGFDAAIVRVSHELAGVAPDIASEFMMLQLEIQAGKDRQRAFLEMAERTGVEEVSSFANVILQAGQYGTSISTVLNAYAEDMRITRELKAQEKANRLPVQMSGVIALTMMPALLIICLAPMFIRWVRLFG